MSYASLARKHADAPALRSKAAASSVAGGLRIGEPNDAHEQEADRVANEVISGRAVQRHWSLASLNAGSSVRRKCSCGASGGAGGECEQCKQEKEAQTLQRKESGATLVAVAPPIVNEVLNSPGHPLDQGTRNLFEARFGHDFSRVRIHADAQAQESTRAVGALAYAVGSDLVFGAGQFAPGTKSGQRLLAHELAHVLQQNAPVPKPFNVAPALTQPKAVMTESVGHYQSPTIRSIQRLPLSRTGIQVQRQLIPVEGSPVPIAGPYTGEKPFPAPPPAPQTPPSKTPPSKTAEECCCCVEDIDLSDSWFQLWNDGSNDMAGHFFQPKIKLAYSGAGTHKSCSLQWWEKTDLPYNLVPKPGVWTQITDPRAGSLEKWKPKEQCPGSETIKLLDPPSLALLPGRTQTRILEFRIIVNSGANCKSCGKPQVKATAKQTLVLMRGKAVESKCKFEVPNPDDK